MSFLHLVNKGLLPDQPKVMPQVLLFLQRERYVEAAQLLQQHAQLPDADAKDFIAHHVQGGVMSESYPSGPLLTAVHKAMQRGDTNHALYLLRAAQGKVRGVKPPKSVSEQMINDFLWELVMCFVIFVGGAVALLMLVRSGRW